MRMVLYFYYMIDFFWKLLFRFLKLSKLDLLLKLNWYLLCILLMMVLLGNHLLIEKLLFFKESYILYFYFFYIIFVWKWSSITMSKCYILNMFWIWNVLNVGYMVYKIDSGDDFTITRFSVEILDFFLFVLFLIF